MWRSIVGMFDRLRWRGTPDVDVLRLDADGLARVSESSGTAFWQIRWTDVKEIAAWKEDLWSVDLICLGFRTSNEPVYHICHEEQPGWNDLDRMLEEHFGIKPETWWSEVAFPAFAPNHRVLWSDRG